MIGVRCVHADEAAGHSEMMSPGPSSAVSLTEAANNVDLIALGHNDRLAH
jgi:hypothetical protein